MVKLKEVQASNAKLDKSTCPRVAVFVGATSGIGRAAVAKLMIATKDKISLRVYIINRRQTAEASKALVDTLLDLNPAVEVISIAGEVALLSEVQRICDEIKDKESSLDLFYHSAGYAPFGGRDQTEGLDTSHSLAHYSRILFMLHLIPLLRKSPHGRVVTVFAGGMESSSIKVDDLNLDKPGNFGPIQSQRQMATMLSMAMEHLADEDSALTFIHSYPGAINTGNLGRGWGNRYMLRAMLLAASVPLIWLLGFSEDECAERTLYTLTTAKFGGHGVPLSSGTEPGLSTTGKVDGGLFLVDQRCDSVMNSDTLTKLRKEAKTKIWEKTMQTLKPYL